MSSSQPTVFVNTSREGVARAKAGQYAYLLESSMLEYYMARDCQLQRVGGLLDSKGYGIAVPKGSPLRDLLSGCILQLQERTVLEALKNKWWQRDNTACPTISRALASSSSVMGIFYVLAFSLGVAALLALLEYSIESRNDSLRLQLTWLGRLIWYRHTQRLHSNNPTTQTHDQEQHVEQQTASPEDLRRLSRLLPLGEESLMHRRLSAESALWLSPPKRSLVVV